MHIPLLTALSFFTEPVPLALALACILWFSFKRISLTIKIDRE